LAKLASNEARERSNLYGFLAAVFWLEPDAPLLSKIREPAFTQALAEAGFPLETIFSGAGDKSLTEDLAAEFARLFVGPGYHVSPYSSVYLDGEGAGLWGPSTCWVKGFIEDTGFDFEPDFNNPPDHITVEFEFMRDVTGIESNLRDEGVSEERRILRTAQKIFITEHLAQWVPVFCDRVTETAHLPFYGAMSGLTKAFIESERAAGAADFS